MEREENNPGVGALPAGESPSQPKDESFEEVDDHSREESETSEPSDTDDVLDEEIRASRPVEVDLPRGFGGKCRSPLCDRIARYGTLGARATACAAHKLRSQVQVFTGKQPCFVCGARNCHWGTVIKGKKSRTRCGMHKEPGMINFTATAGRKKRRLERRTTEETLPSPSIAQQTSPSQEAFGFMPSTPNNTNVPPVHLQTAETTKLEELIRQLKLGGSGGYFEGPIWRGPPNSFDGQRPAVIFAAFRAGLRSTVLTLHPDWPMWYCIAMGLQNVSISPINTQVSFYSSERLTPVVMPEFDLLRPVKQVLLDPDTTIEVRPKPAVSGPF